MALSFRILLIFVAVLLLFFVIRRIRKASLRIEASIFWVIFSILLVVMAVFPEISMFAASALGVISPANLVFAFIIFLLLVKGFTQSLEISGLEQKLENLTRKLALDEKERETVRSEEKGRN